MLTSFVCSWILTESVLLKIEFIPPFNILGNWFWNVVPFIQFYEYTGVLGGSLWALGANVLIFYIIRNSKKALIAPAFIYIFLPAFVSCLYYYRPDKPCSKELNVFLVHLNDNDKSAGDYQLVKNITNEIEKSTQDLNNALIILPENTLTNQNRLEFLNDNIEFYYLKYFARRHPNVSIITGAEVLEQSLQPSQSMSKYNAAVYIDSAKYQIISKSLFVPFEEKIPGLLRWIPSLTTYYQTKKTLRHFEKDGIKIGVFICYESFFGSYIAKQTGKGSHVITVLTKEAGLYDNPLAFSQYLGIIKLRAIEQRKYILKSSNTGYTAIISNKGKEIYVIPPGSNTQFIANNIPLNDKTTIYSMFGNYISWFSCIVLAILCFRRRSNG
jgi:apolipoprotein N-acyltransferase